MILYNLRRRQPKPLINTNIRKLGRLQHLEEDHVFRARVFDVVALRHGDVSHVAGLEIERAGGFGCGEEGDAGGALEEEIPLVGGEMPVDFAHGARLHDDKGGGEVVGDGEGGGISDFDGAAGDSVRCLLAEMEGVGLVGG